MSNTALGRTEVALLTNKSGGSVAQGDVVIVDTANASAFTTTTSSAYVSGRIGVVLEPNGIASNGVGLVAFSGYVPVINLSGTGSIGDLVKTHTVAKQGVRHSAPQVAGDFAQVLGTTATPAALLFGTVQLGPGSTTVYEPWLVDIIAATSKASANTGTWTLVVWADATYPLGGGGLQSSGTQNDALSWDVVLSAGTWECIIHCRKSTNTGIFTLNQDGASMGTADSYNGSIAYGALSITGWTVSTTGKKTMQLKLATKNGSSSGYYGQIFAVSFRRTA
jgi:hypothetical protein